jgi:hypothetical protein
MSLRDIHLDSILSDYYHCARIDVRANFCRELSLRPSYFSLRGSPVYGRAITLESTNSPNDDRPTVHIDVDVRDRTVVLPFDPKEVIENCLFEKYVARENGKASRAGVARKVYYFFRPLMPVAARKHLQRFSLRGWDRILFPRWPVDLTVDHLYEMLLADAMRAQGISDLPFVWFWPNGYCACTSITHDVETVAGRDFCSSLMDINDSFDIKSSFQVVPEERYEVAEEFLGSIRDRGFEVNVHDLNHDGNLFIDYAQFLDRVKKINMYAKKFKARGFRSAVLYRNMDWMDALEFEYDMSVPNVAHLDPQRGGCCTVMPYFVGERLEIPVTATQDYALFHILSDYSTRLWEQQISIIKEAHGLASFIVHPDYVIERRARSTYERLLAHLSSLREEHNVWVALPSEINDWWRARAKMRVSLIKGRWQVEGEGSGRARVAFATLENDRLRYRIQ